MWDMHVTIGLAVRSADKDSKSLLETWLAPMTTGTRAGVKPTNSTA